jgi:hypothetical protein
VCIPWFKGLQFLVLPSQSAGFALGKKEKYSALSILPIGRKGIGVELDA